MLRRVAAALVLCLASGTASGSAEPSVTTCFGSSATIVAGPGEIFGTEGPDVIVASDDGQHFIHALGGDDKVCGGAGSDSIEGGPGNDQIDGGPGGPDVAFYLTATGPIHADLTTGVATGAGNDTLVSVDSLIGGSFDDMLIGDANINALFGLEGNDQLDGGPNWDVMMGGPGNDSVLGSAGDGDAAVFLLADQGVTADLQSGTATGEGTDTLRGIDTLMGSKHDDTLRGDNRPNSLLGLGGNDVLQGRGGDDVLFGEDTSGGNPTFGTPGSDRLDGGPGDDTLFGGAGLLIGDTFIGGAGSNDMVSYATAPNGVGVDLAKGRASGEGPDRLSGIEDVTGSTWADRLVGDAKPNSLVGGDGSDTLTGGSGDDFLGGGNGTDTARGGRGRDYCLDDETSSGCEIGGLPPIVGSAGTPPGTIATDVLRALRGMTGVTDTLGPAIGATPAVRSTAGYQYSAEPVCIAAAHGGITEIAPPRIVDPVGTDGAAEEAWWRGTLVRGNPKRGATRRVQMRTAWARAQLGGASLIPGGLVVWKDATGRHPFASTVGVHVGRGRYYWIGLIYWVRSGGKVFAPVEPHIIRARTVRHDKSCTFG
jgi:Ca2+-binding RTX toxin-like protein